MTSHGISAEAGNLRQNLVRRLHLLEGVWGFVVDSEEVEDGGFEFANTVMGAPLELLVGENRKPPLDLIEPRGVRRNVLASLDRGAAALARANHQPFELVT